MISACMIVLDEEECIARALDSIHPYVDEIIIVDGGSKDRTKEIVSTYEKVVLIENLWPEDYSIQRNLAIEHAKGDWIFSLDADEYIAAYVGENLTQLTKYEDKDIYNFEYRYFLEGRFVNILYEERHPKLFRSYCRWVNRMHERVTNFKFTPVPVSMEIFHDKKLTWQIKDNQHYWDMGQGPDRGWVKIDDVWQYKPEQYVEKTDE